MAEIEAIFPDSLALAPGTPPAWEQIPAKGAV